MSNETIGYNPETVTIPAVSAEMLKTRKPKSREKTEITFVNLNSIDQRLLAMPEDLFDAIAVKMATKNISALDIDSNL
ncbi:MAG TPA: hypothetical protein PLJ21_12970 [Pseudobdellovibrionaceae bacterium]|nr:hypothetical protein [Candidatus Woesebacteria bacterium]HPI41714.1 hypothetical protein [Pseudobdellovibrionaceae bacterium]